MEYVYYGEDAGEDDYLEDYDLQYTEEEDIRWQSTTSQHTLETCILPSITQIGSYVLLVIGWSFACRVIWTCTAHFLVVKHEWFHHLTSLLCGFAALYFTVGHDFLIVLLLSILAYVLMLILEYRGLSNMGFTVATITICCHFLYEITLNKPDAWQRIRGIQMVATMKMISFAFDLNATESESKENLTSIPGLVPFLGYLFCPATCVLGPWIPYNAYISALRTKHVRLRWAVWTVLNALLAVAFLCLSNCIVPLLCSDHSWIWFRTYRDALAVRCSHYFICFLSQATIAAAGITLQANSRQHNAFFGSLITKPLLIELPRSLSAVVRSWNTPMHAWLKKYIFRAAHNRFKNYFVAILYTYAVSSLLHGLHFRIYLVLLSLGCLSYVENVLRTKLANIFSACITSSSCRGKSCGYTYCPQRSLWDRKCSSCLVLAVNFTFSLLAIFHLAYLGVMMSEVNSGGAEEENQKSWRNSLAKWSELNYTSHWISLTSYIFYYLI